MRLDIEHCKTNTPLCIELITKAKTCDTNCPYRHVLTGTNDTYVPEFGFVNMELLEVIAPNHFAVRVFGHKRRLEHKSKPVQSFHEEWTKFEEKLCEFYSENDCESRDSVKIGDLCLIFQQNKPKRCRVLSKLKESVRVYLIDIGKTRHYTISDLYDLDEEFQDFPAQVIEVFALGYLASDCSPVWLPEATQCVKQLMKVAKKKSTTDCYLQAEVIKTFDRTLIVKNVKILTKIQNHHRSMSIAQQLIKCGFADQAKIELHYIFSNDDDFEQPIVVQAIDFMETAGIQEEESRRRFTNTPSSDLASPLSDFDDYDAFQGGHCNVASIQESDNSVALWRSEHITSDDQPAAPANSPVSENHDFVITGAPVKRDNGFAHEMKHSEHLNGQNHDNLSIINGTATSVTSTLSLDEILDSLPENIQATMPPSLIKCSPRDEVDHTTEQEDDGVGWLIDFSDSDTNDMTIVASSLFSSVRVINSIDDLL